MINATQGNVKPFEIDNMTLNQLMLYYEKPNSYVPPEVLSERSYAQNLEILKGMIVEAGREVPTDLGNWHRDDLTKLWFELGGDKGKRSNSIQRVE